VEPSNGSCAPRLSTTENKTTAASTFLMFEIFGTRKGELTAEYSLRHELTTRKLARWTTQQQLEIDRDLNVQRAKVSSQ